MADVHQIIATMNPDLYYDTSSSNPDIYNDRDTDKEKIKKFKGYIQREGFLKAADKAKAKFLEQHKIVYDSSSETLEPIYFFLLDLMSDMGLAPAKLVDNFTSSPGSGHFSELGQRATIMQQQASKILGDINNVVRSMLNLVYDLKEFKIRLETYNDIKSQDKGKQEAALLSLKQVWMDRVDINKGNSSIKGMAVSGQVGYQTLIDAFLFVKDEKAVDKVDLNDRVKRVIKQRIHEFNLWLAESEKELRKRYELERKYLKSQVNSVRVYARWAKPYLKAAQQLEMKENSRNPALIKVFNTILLDLTLLGKSKFNIKSAVDEFKLPKDILKLQRRGHFKRDYFGCVLVEFNFRGIPTKTSPYQQHYVFGGRCDITFTAYSLNNEEIEKINWALSKSDVEDALKLVEGATGSIEDLQADIDMFLKEEEKSEEKAKKREMGVSPFLALFGFYEKKGNKAEATANVKPEDEKIVKPDNFLEKNYLRPLAGDASKKSSFDLFDIYKKAHQMESHPPLE